MSDEKISGRAALALGSTCTQLERLNAEVAKARVYLGVGKNESSRWCFRAARKEAQKLARELHHLDIALRQDTFLPKEAPVPPVPPSFKVVK